ncbi:MAG TPA: hypothetical protein VF268_05075 [Gammaproteobacteria bacterium]|jgi:hypothetical protein
MNQKSLVIAILVAASAVVVLFIFQNSKRQDSDLAQSLSSPPGPSSNHEPGHALNRTPVTAGKDGRQTIAADSSINEELQEKYAEVSDNAGYPELENRLEAMQTRRGGKSFDPRQVVETMTQTEAWTRVETPHDDLPLTQEEKFDGREYIRFNPMRIETLMPGDTLEIPIWQLGERYTMRVDHTETHANGSVTWHGHLENFNDPHRVTITVGDGLSLGGIDTPGGHYVLQAHGESGWIASSETLFKRNEAETDMIIPPAGELEGNS